MDSKSTEKIAKVIAHAGVCSRRAAEELVRSGRVTINGVVEIEPATRVQDDDAIVVDGKPIKRSTKSRLFLFYKPVGCITSTKDDKNRPLIFDFLPHGLPRLITVGRLDYNSEGLLLLTNDGGLARRLELPSSGLKRVYRVRAFGDVTEQMTKEIGSGLTIDGVNYKPAIIELERRVGDNVWAKMTISEGKNREIRKIFEHYGMQVSRLIRISYGRYNLGTLKPAQIIEVHDKNNFRDI